MTPALELFARAAGVNMPKLSPAEALAQVAPLVRDTRSCRGAPAHLRINALAAVAMTVASALPERDVRAVPMAPARDAAAEGLDAVEALVAAAVDPSNHDASPARLALSIVSLVAALVDRLGCLDAVLASFGEGATVVRAHAPVPRPVAAPHRARNRRPGERRARRGEP